MKLTFVLFLFFTINVFSQDSLSYNYFDKKTYELYAKQDWGELIKVTKQAFDKGYNSYYFQMRIGIAYYERKNYVKATKYFENASEYNVNPTLKKYLYYAYLYSGYNYKAEYYSNFFTDTLTNKLGVKNNFVKSVDIYGGSFINNNASSLSNLEFHNANKYVSSSIRFNNKYNTTFGLGLNFNISNRIKTYINYSYLNETKTQITKINNYASIPTYNTETYTNNTTQNSLYFNLKYLSNGFSLTTALNILKISDEFFDFGNTNDNKVISSTDIVFGINMQQKIANFEIGLRGTYSNLNNHRQLLAEIEAVYYPFGNKNLYLIASTGYQNIAEKTTTIPPIEEQPNKFSSIETNNITKVLLGFKASKFLWIEAQAYFGRINEYNEANSFVVYNDILPITNQYRINLTSPITKHLSVFVKYAYNTRDQYYYNFNIINSVNPDQLGTSVETTINTTKINNSSIIGGITWTF